MATTKVLNLKIIFLIFIFTQICKSFIDINFSNINKNDCKVYGLQCDKENGFIKFYKENTSFIGFNFFKLKNKIFI